jgi:hypothetical protein
VIRISDGNRLVGSEHAMPAILMNSQTPTESSENGGARANRGSWFTLQFLRALAAKAKPPRPRRLLFLDDDPRRAEAFLSENPQAVWVTTVAECLERMTESWDEIHLDHDLGGQHFVDSNQDNCGMEVIRWLCKEPRPHLNETSFLVHTHNSAAGLLMVLQMRACGYDAEFRPFGLDIAALLAHNEPAADAESEASIPVPASDRSWLRRLLSFRSWLRATRSARPLPSGPEHQPPASTPGRTRIDR